MKAKDLIKELKKLNPDKEVMIQQGGEQDYMTVMGIKEIQVFDEDAQDKTGILNIIGVQFV